jgi:hypothetical protein
MVEKNTDVYKSTQVFLLNIIFMVLEGILRLVSCMAVRVVIGYSIALVLRTAHNEVRKWYVFERERYNRLGQIGDW